MALLPALPPPSQPHGHRPGGLRGWAHWGGAGASHAAAGAARWSLNRSRAAGAALSAALATPLGADVARAAAYSAGAACAGILTARALEHPARALQVKLTTSNEVKSAQAELKVIAKDGLGLAGRNIGLGVAFVGVAMLAGKRS